MKKLVCIAVLLMGQTAVADDYWGRRTAWMEARRQYESARARYLADLRGANEIAFLHRKIVGPPSIVIDERQYSSYADFKTSGLYYSWLDAHKR